MNNKIKDLITIVIFCAFLGVMTVLYILLPEETFSENEKRYLSEFPKAEWSDIASGDWGSDVETYLADHIPGRNFFVGLNAYFDLYTGRQVGKDVRVHGDRILEAPVKWDQDAVSQNMTTIRNLSEVTGRTIDLMIVPSAGWAALPEDYPDEAYIQEIYAEGADSVNTIDVTSLFAGRPDLYFRTDHHWNSAGAHSAYNYYMELHGRASVSADSFDIEIATDFQGSTYSRSALWLIPGEDLEIWHGSSNFTVTNGETEGTHQGVIYPERLQEADKYTVFLDGNHSIVRIQNPEADGKILVVRDSYSNLLGCFLAESYGEVVLVDLRYYRQPVSQLIAEEAFDDILICYSLSNFMTDTNLIWLR